MRNQEVHRASAGCRAQKPALLMESFRGARALIIWVWDFFSPKAQGDERQLEVKIGSKIGESSQ